MFDPHTHHPHSDQDAPTRAMPIWPPPDRPVPVTPSAALAAPERPRRLLADQAVMEPSPWRVEREAPRSPMVVFDERRWQQGLVLTIGALAGVLLIGVAWMLLSGRGSGVQAGDLGAGGVPAAPLASPSTMTGLTADGADGLATLPDSSSTLVPAAPVPSSSTSMPPTTAASTTTPTTASTTSAPSTTSGTSSTASTASEGSTTSSASSSSTTSPSGVESTMTPTSAGGSTTSTATGPGTSSTAPASSSTSTTAAPPAAPAPPPAGGTSAIRQSILDLTNAERAKAGCGPLVLDSTLTAVADAHSADMAARGFFSHTNPDGLGPGDRIDASGYPYRAWAENIAAGQSSAAQVMSGWMNSSGHRANILNCGLEQLGVGYAEGPAQGQVPGRFWTQVFGTRR